MADIAQPRDRTALGETSIIIGSLYIAPTLSKDLVRVGIYDNGYEILELDELLEFKTYIVKVLYDMLHNTDLSSNKNEFFNDLYVGRCKDTAYIGIRGEEYEVLELEEIKQLKKFLDKLSLYIK